MKLLITGARGFLGRSLVSAATEAGHEVLPFDLETPKSKLKNLVSESDFIYHLAGINRPKTPEEFESGNVEFTANLIEACRITGRSVPIAFSSLVQATHQNPYGQSKHSAERHLNAYAETSKAPVYNFRFHNLFGK
jgi:UDP-2-acetamido-2,6-beta-L-arabino-hexul-4-ose reductase